MNVWTQEIYGEKYFFRIRIRERRKKQWTFFGIIFPEELFVKPSMVTDESLKHQVIRERRSTEKKTQVSRNVNSFSSVTALLDVPCHIECGWKKHRILNEIQLRLINSMCRRAECANLYSLGFVFQCFIFKIIVVFSKARWEDALFGCCHTFYEWVSMWSRVLIFIRFVRFIDILIEASHTRAKVKHARILCANGPRSNYIVCLFPPLSRFRCASCSSCGRRQWMNIHSGFQWIYEGNLCAISEIHWHRK